MSKLIEIDRGYDKQSINRHSWREFTYPNNTRHYIISRCMDANPPYFEAYMVSDTNRMLMPLDLPEGSGNIYFCDGKSWKDAIEFFEKENFGE